jgi:3-methylfumaryl-CoA hydratase
MIESSDDAPAVVEREEVCAQATVRRVAAMLDVAGEVPAAGQALPRGWHFVLLGADTPRGALRADGFPGLGVPMPDLGLPRLMLGGRSVAFHHDIPVGATLRRRSVLQNLVHKTTAAGPMAVVTLGHALHLGDGLGQHLGDSDEPALVETQTYVLLPAGPAKPASPKPGEAAPTPSEPPQPSAWSKTVVADDTLLFQYSALGFNSHRIHLDREHARQVEGFPDLVVNGGLVTLLLTEFLRCELGGVPNRYTVRHVAPLFCNRTITLTADPAEHGWLLKAFDAQHRLAVTMEVTV